MCTYIYPIYLTMDGSCWKQQSFFQYYTYSKSLLVFTLLYCMMREIRSMTAVVCMFTELSLMQENGDISNSSIN